MKCEFEEKEFETQINSEMRIRFGYIYAPGQVLENIIGIDVAVVCQNSNMWQYFNPPYPSSLFPTQITSSGVELRSSYWSSLSQALDYFPQTKFHVFLQHKRPEYMGTKQSKHWRHWNLAHFRYEITKHQQVALSNLSNIAGDDAIVGYSCPAFLARRALWNHAMDSKLVENTNFARASQLNGHDYYTFISAASHGIACSEPTIIPNFNFTEESERLTRREIFGSNSERILRLSKYVEKAAEQAGLESELIDAQYVIPGEVDQIGRAIIRISAFAKLTNSTWMWG